MFLGRMAYLDPKGEGTRACQESGGHASRRGRCAAAGFARYGESLIACTPISSRCKVHPPERRLKPAPRPALAFFRGQRNLRGGERCPVRAFKEMSGAPKSR